MLRFSFCALAIVAGAAFAVGCGARPVHLDDAGLPVGWNDDADTGYGNGGTSGTYGGGNAGASGNYGGNTGGYSGSGVFPGNGGAIGSGNSDGGEEQEPPGGGGKGKGGRQTGGGGAIDAGFNTGGRDASPMMPCPADALMGGMCMSPTCALYTDAGMSAVCYCRMKGNRPGSWQCERP